MNKKNILSKFVIMTIVLAVFIAAALTPARTSAASAAAAAVAVEDNTSGSGIRAIPDNQIPLAQAPFMADLNITLWLIVVAVSALITGIVIFEDCRSEGSEKTC